MVEIRDIHTKLLCDNQIIYAELYERSHTLEEASKLTEGVNIQICGRIIYKRNFGKLIFMKLGDLNGILQISFSKEDMSALRFNVIKKIVKVGDFIATQGILYKTKTSELTLCVEKYKILSVATRALPEKFHGIKNTSLCYRNRYLDLITNKNTKDIFIKRCKIISFIRNYLTQQNFLEIDTPILQSVVFGAEKPFVTRQNDLNKDFILRITPELYLKQAIVGGFDRIFEIGKCFSNEGIDASNLQEFTMLEWYVAYWDYKNNLSFLRKFLFSLLDCVLEKRQLVYNGHTIDFDGVWAKIDFCNEISKLINSNVLDYCNVNELKIAIRKYDQLSRNEIDKANSISELINMLYKKRILPYIIQPTILYNFPACLFPSARRNNNDKRTIDGFQLVVCGIEIVTAYSELIDPKIQKQTFEELVNNRINKGEKTFEPDWDYIKAMEYGMPPASGVRVGIDHLVAILCNQSSLRKVILFPPVR